MREFRSAVYAGVAALLLLSTAGCSKTNGEDDPEIRDSGAEVPRDTSSDIRDSAEGGDADDAGPDTTDSGGLDSVDGGDTSERQPTSDEVEWLEVRESGERDGFYDIEAADAGGFYVCGGLGEAFGNGEYQGGVRDAVLFEVRADGSIGWSTTFGTSSDDVARRLEIGPSGDLFVAGVTTGALGELSREALTKTFVGRFSSDGTRKWIDGLRDGWSAPEGLALSGADPVVVGRAEDTGFRNSDTDPATDAYLATFDGTTGRRQELRFTSRSKRDYAMAVTASANGGYWLTYDATGDSRTRAVVLRSYAPDGTETGTHELATDGAISMDSKLLRYDLVAGANESIWTVGYRKASETVVESYLTRRSSLDSPAFETSYGTQGLAVAVGGTRGPQAFWSVGWDRYRDGSGNQGLRPMLARTSASGSRTGWWVYGGVETLATPVAVAVDDAGAVLVAGEYRSGLRGSRDNSEPAAFVARLR